MNLLPRPRRGLYGASLALPIAGLILPVALAAQTAAPTKSIPSSREVESSEDTAGDQPVVLNPFEVNTDKDKGFLATNAGTATRLGIDLKEMAAPYSVMTGEFLKTMGITKVEDAAIWSTNGAPVLDGQGADMFVVNGGARVNNATTMYFARGVITNAGQQRNYFLNAGTNDMYNVERVDLGRGPNAVLFNVGASSALGGGYSTIGKRARLDDNFTTVGLTTGSWDYYRSTLDSNYVVRDNFALRTNLMWQQRNGWIESTMDDRTGATLAATWRINEKSELNVEVRRDKIERTNPVVPFTDILSGWDGSTITNGRITGAQNNGVLPLTGTNQTLRTFSYTDNAGVTQNVALGRLEGIERLGNTFIYDPSTGMVMDWEGMGVTRRADSDIGVPLYATNGKTYIRNSTYIPSYGAYGASGGNRDPGTLSQNGHPSFLDATNLPIDYSRQVNGSNFRVPGRRESNLTDTPVYTEVTRGAFLNFTHKFTDDLLFEAQADFTEVDMKALQSNSLLPARELRIDINRNLPNGQPNPHFLDAYGEIADMVYGTKLNRNAGFRAALAYQKDLGAWGRYTFNVSTLGTERIIKTRNYARSMKFTSTDSRDWHDGGNRMRVRYYMNDTERPFWDINPTSFLNVTSTGTGNAQTYDTSTVAVSPDWVAVDWQDREERNLSGIFAMAGRWLDNKLIVSPGVRYGVQRTYRRDRATAWGNMPDDASWDGRNVSADGYWKPDAPADWADMRYFKAYTVNGSLVRATTPSIPFSRPYLLKAGTNDVRYADPYYAGDRFRDDYNFPQADLTDLATTLGVTYSPVRWAALKLSYGSSFVPGDVGRYLLNGEEAESEEGVAYDVGVTFSLFNDRLAITPRYYYNRAQNILNGGGAAATEINKLVETRRWNDPVAGNINTRGYGLVWGQDYRSQYNDGFELEIAGEITRGWRLSANLGTAQVVTFKRNPLSHDYVMSRVGELKDMLEDAGGMLDTSTKPVNSGRTIDYAPGVAKENPTVMAAISAGIPLNDGTLAKASTVTDAVNAYNRIWTNLDNNAHQAESYDLDRLTAKLVTDYSFRSGRLKGFRVGVAALWIQRDRAGYRGGETLVNPAYNSSAPISTTNSPWIDNPDVDSSTIVWTKRPLDIRALFGYTRRIEGLGMLDGTELDVQLNIENLFDKRTVYYQDDGVALRAPDGNLDSVVREAVPSRVAEYQLPLNYELSVTLKF